MTIEAAESIRHSAWEALSSDQANMTAENIHEIKRTHAEMTQIIEQHLGQMALLSLEEAGFWDDTKIAPASCDDEVVMDKVSQEALFYLDETGALMGDNEEGEV